MGAALPIIAVAATVIGTGVSIYGAEQSGAAQTKAANYQAAVAQNNAITAQANAAYATSAGEAQQESQAMSTRALLGNEKAAQASSGLDVNSGSAVDVRSSAAELGALSGLNIGSNAALKAAAYRAQAGGLSAQSNLDIMQGQQASTAANINAVGAAIGGAGSASSYWNQQLLTNPAMGGIAPPPIAGANVSTASIVH